MVSLICLVIFRWVGRGASGWLISAPLLSFSKVAWISLPASKRVIGHNCFSRLCLCHLPMSHWLYSKWANPASLWVQRDVILQGLLLLQSTTQQQFFPLPLPLSPQPILGTYIGQIKSFPLYRLCFLSCYPYFVKAHLTLPFLLGGWQRHFHSCFLISISKQDKKGTLLCHCNWKFCGKTLYLLNYLP